MSGRLKEERGAIAVLAALTIVILLAAVAFVDRHQPALPRAPGAAERRGLRLAGRRPGPPRPRCPGSDHRQRRRAQGGHGERATGDGGQPHDHVPVRRRRPRRRRRARSRRRPVRLRSDGELDSGWMPKGATRLVHDCNPFAGDKCNTIRLSTSSTIPYYFAPVIGINTGSTGAVNAASCKGACGAASSPLDVVIVLDRTGSMTDCRRREREERGSVDPRLLQLAATVGRVGSAPLRTEREQVQRQQPADVSAVQLSRTGRWCRSALTTRAPTAP